LRFLVRALTFDDQGRLYAAYAASYRRPADVGEGKVTGGGTYLARWNLDRGLVTAEAPDTSQLTEAAGIGPDPDGGRLVVIGRPMHGEQKSAPQFFFAADLKWTRVTADEPEWLHPVAGAVSADGKRVLAAATDGAVTVWEREGRQLTPVVELKAFPRAGPDNACPVAAFSRAGDLVARIHVAAGNMAVEIWDISRAKPVARGRPIELPRDASCLAFSPDGRRIAVGEGGGRVRIWPVPAAERP